MGKKKVIEDMNRHNLVEISEHGRKNIFNRIMKSVGSPCIPKAHLEDIKQLIVEGYSKVKVPGIIRRIDELEIKDGIAVGFSSPLLYDGRRLRIPAIITQNEIEKITTPYDTLKLHWEARNSCLEALKEIKEEAFKNGLKLGVWGSAGLEIYTKLPYTHKTSDLDLLLTNTDYIKILNFNNFLKKIKKEYRCNLDMELDLPNGYGIKVEELFMDTDYILAKGLYDVRLIPKQKILQNLQNCCI